MRLEKENALPVQPSNIRFKKVSDLQSEELAGMDEVVYVRAGGNVACSLNLTASAILDLCDGTHSMDDIVDLICESLHADPEQVRKDAETIMKEFVEYGLVCEV